MARRVEAQIARDWSVGFVTWNCLFRSAVNLSRTFFAYDKVKPDDENHSALTPDDLTKGAIQTMQALYASTQIPRARSAM